MFRYLRFFLGPLLFSGVALLMFRGGAWLWAPGMLLIAAVSLLDQLFPFDVEEKPYRQAWLMDLALYLSTPAAMLLFFTLFWVAGSGTRDALGVGAFIQAHTGFDAVAARNLRRRYSSAARSANSSTVAVARPRPAARSATR